MDVIIACHTEFGFVHDREVIYDKRAINGIQQGVTNLIDIADRYNAKVTFVVCPEVVEYFPQGINHEIGLHIHPGWQEFHTKGGNFYVGDSYLRKHCNQSIDSTSLTDYTYEKQLEMIKAGKERLYEVLKVDSQVFVAGRWSMNDETVRALIEMGITHDCSAVPHSKAAHYNWTKLPRICMPYHPSEKGYQLTGNLPLLIVPVSQAFGIVNVNPEAIPVVGFSWLKACFTEYYHQNLPLFHIHLHSPCMTEQYFISAMNELLKFISKHKDVDFKFASTIKENNIVMPKTNIFPYLPAINRDIMGSFLKSRILHNQ